MQSGAAIFHAQAYIPTQPAQAKQEAWLSHAHEDPGRQEGYLPPPRQRAEAGLREARLPRVAFRVPLTSTVETFSRPAQHEGVLDNARLKIRSYYAMPSKKAARFPRTARLLRHADFERVYKQGRRHFSASMTVFYWPRPETMRSRRRQSAPITGSAHRIHRGPFSRRRCSTQSNEAPTSRSSSPIPSSPGCGGCSHQSEEVAADLRLRRSSN